MLNKDYGGNTGTAVIVRNVFGGPASGTVRIPD